MTSSKPRLRKGAAGSRLPLAIGALVVWLAGCASVSGGSLPEEPPTFTDFEVREVERLTLACEYEPLSDYCYSGVLTVLEKLTDYACDNQALAGRDDDCLE